MAGGDILGIVIVGAIILGGIWMIQQGGGLQALMGPMGGGAPESEPAPAPEPEAEAPPAEDSEPDQEYDQPEQTVTYPVPVPIPVYVPGLSRRQICSEYYNGNCRSECRDYGFGSRICQECISYCGPPRNNSYDPPYKYRPPRRMPKPRYPPRCPPGQHWDSNDGKCIRNYGGPGPNPGQDCPRGQRYNWQKKKCEPVPQPGQPKPPTCPSGQSYDERRKKCMPVPSETPEPAPTPAPAPETPPAEEAPPAASNYASYYGGYW